MVSNENEHEERLNIVEFWIECLCIMEHCTSIVLENKSLAPLYQIRFMMGGAYSIGEPASITSLTLNSWCSRSPCKLPLFRGCLWALLGMEFFVSFVILFVFLVCCPWPWINVALAVANHILSSSMRVKVFGVSVVLAETLWTLTPSWHNVCPF